MSTESGVAQRSRAADVVVELRRGLAEPVRRGEHALQQDGSDERPATRRRRLPVPARRLGAFRIVRRGARHASSV